MVMINRLMNTTSSRCKLPTQIILMIIDFNMDYSFTCTVRQEQHVPTLNLL